MIAVVYMPCEASGNDNATLFDEILEVLDIDMQEIKNLNLPSILMGDFNSHVGDTSGNSMGIPNNNKKIGVNGLKLTLWLKNGTNA